MKVKCLACDIQDVPGGLDRWWCEPCAQMIFRVSDYRLAVHPKVLSLALAGDKDLYE